MSDDKYDDPNSTKGFSHRQQRPLKDFAVGREPLKRYVDKLIELEAKTHPQNSSVADKDRYAREALLYAGKLVDVLAGWAMDHQAGIALNDVTGFPWTDGDAAAKEQADDHRHEFDGGNYLDPRGSGLGDGGAPEINQRILAAVIGKAAVLPVELRHELAEALKALNEGEQQPLLKPRKGQDRMGRSLWQSRLAAISHVYFLKEIGQQKKEAIDFVADAYGVGSDAVKSWDKTGLKKHFGSNLVSGTKDRAERLGKGVYRRQNTIPQDEDDRDFIRIHLDQYGRPGVVRGGQKFLKLQRSKG